MLANPYFHETVMREKMQDALRQAAEDRIVDEANNGQSEGSVPSGKILGLVFSASIVIALLLA
jgi:hypothetical protein